MWGGAGVPLGVIGAMFEQAAIRYEVRKTNDVLHVFDTVEYSAVAAFPANHKAQAVLEVARLNEGA